MQRKRIAWFIVMIAVGLGLSLIYGWMIHPIKPADITADTLRVDYKTDYVLMVSEIYKKDGDLEEAASRLAMIDNRPADEVMADGLMNARSLGYAPADLSLIEALAQAFQKAFPTEETPKP